MLGSITWIGFGWIGRHFMAIHRHQWSDIVTITRSSYPSIDSTHFLYDTFKSNLSKLPLTDYCIITLPFSRQLTDPNDYLGMIQSIVRGIDLSQ